jgi:hypothetical protein
MLTDDAKEFGDSSFARPGGEHQAPALAANSREFGCRLFVVPCEHHAERRDHAIEAAVRERQAFGVGKLKRDGRAHMRGQFAGRRQKVGGDVDGGDAGAGTCDVARRPAGAGGNVQNLLVSLGG